MQTTGQASVTLVTMLSMLYHAFRRHCQK